MTELVFCYHCRRQHRRDEVRLVQTRGVKRWRCRKSIAFSRNSTAQRDSFGKAVSELNQAACAVHAGRPLAHAILDVFSTPLAASEGPA